MATFSSLPNELLVEIWRHVLQPEDIERLAMSSRKIRAALVAHAKYSLNTLILRSRALEKYFIGSFRSFEVLKKLDMDYRFLVDCSRRRTKIRIYLT